MSSRARILVVSTPIGNLGDLSERARQALEAADIVACEDTRRTGRLLAHLGIKRRLVSLHEHNEKGRVPRLLEAARGGDVVVLVSDAGTPLVCDPGFHLVREAHKEGVQVEALPGASALLCALVSSGLPPHPFTFAGFPPPKQGRRRTFFKRFENLDHTLVFYESPHRLLASLGDAVEVFGDREAVIARELTKIHEEVVRDRLSGLLSRFAELDKIRGELVLLISGTAL